MIEVGHFYRMKNNTLEEYGFAKGDPLFIVGSGFVPDSKTDPYKYRLVFVAAAVKDGHVQIGDKGFTVDGKNLSKCTKIQLEYLEANRNEDFGGKENNKEQAQEIPVQEGA